jgi:hypothetical protein
VEPPARGPADGRERAPAGREEQPEAAPSGPGWLQRIFPPIDWTRGEELWPGANTAERTPIPGIGEAAEWLGVVGRRIPGGAISGAGTALQQPDVVVARAEYRTQDWRLRQLQAMEAIDEGRPFNEALAHGPPRLRRRDGSVIPSEEADLFMRQMVMYRSMSPEERQRQRARVESDFSTFNPTPIQERPLFRAGQAVTEYGRRFHRDVLEDVLGLPDAEGYDDNSFAAQVGAGLGSMLSGIPVRMLTGPLGAATFFGAMGGGEATERAVQFDRAERAAGRPGLAQEQIIAAGLLGIGPGTTDVLPIETLLRGLPMRIPASLRTSLARSIGRIGGQAFVEGVQEGSQQFLQNVIAWHVYNPNQVMTQDVWGNLLVGYTVGGVTETGTEALRVVARRRNRGTKTDERDAGHSAGGGDPGADGRGDDARDGRPPAGGDAQAVHHEPRAGDRGRRPPGERAAIREAA